MESKYEIRNKDISRQFLKYSISGGIGAIIDFSLFSLLVTVFPDWVFNIKFNFIQFRNNSRMLYAKKLDISVHFK